MEERHVAEFLGRIKQIIDKNGWAVQAVFPVEEGNDYLIYSVGLAARGLPEFAAVGLPENPGQTIINRIAAWTIENGVPPLGEEWGKKELSMSVPFFLIPRPELEINVARLFEHDAAVIQILWPDKNGRWPWDDKADPDCRRQLQPRLAS
jgi:hypothetical protein